jgi:hypothetical protein
VNQKHLRLCWENQVLPGLLNLDIVWLKWTLWGDGSGDGGINHNHTSVQKLLGAWVRSRGSRQDDWPILDFLLANHVTLRKLLSMSDASQNFLLF